MNNQLWGICKKAIENNMCLGCMKLENPNFTGQAQCEYVKEPRQRIREMLGLQEKIEL